MTSSWTRARNNRRCSTRLITSKSTRTTSRGARRRRRRVCLAVSAVWTISSRLKTSARTEGASTRSFTVTCATSSTGGTRTCGSTLIGYTRAIPASPVNCATRPAPRSTTWRSTSTRSTAPRAASRSRSRCRCSTTRTTSCRRSSKASTSSQ
jgi:hypothetical protein